VRTSETRPSRTRGRQHKHGSRANLVPVGRVLVVNAGSTGMKLGLVDDDERGAAIESAAAAPADLLAVGHRVVHGGAEFVGPVLLDDEVLGRLEAMIDLAPLHNAPALAAIRSTMAALPSVPQVAVFDTAFHADLPPEATTYAVPRRWREEWGIRRYGFHGLSVAWSLESAAALLGRPAGELRLVVCHLGGGASATAVAGGRSADTTMGFGPLDGLVMATRSGSLDPEIPLHLVLRRGLTAREVEGALNHESGLSGLTGVSDMREVEARARRGDPDAALALAVYDRRLAAAVAGMLPVLGRLDAVVFTGGVGEGSARVRAAAALRLAPLGVNIDPDANEAGTGDRDIAGPDSPTRVLVVHAREDVIIARAVRSVV
jgi:acetate kinase